MGTVLLFKNADVFSPERLGKKDVLCIEGKFISIGKIENQCMKAAAAFVQFTLRCFLVMKSGHFSPFKVTGSPFMQAA